MGATWKKMVWKGLRILIFFTLGLTGCQAEVVPPSPAVPEVWRVQVSPALRVLGSDFNDCIQQLPGRALLF